MNNPILTLPAEWHDFFLAVGGGAAALTGLAFVGMSLHLDIILSRPVLMNRARGILTNLSAAFLRCSLVLMGGQSLQAVGAEIFVVCAIGMVTGFLSYRATTRSVRTVPHAVFWRYLGGAVCFAAEMAGAVIVYAGNVWGLYVAGVAMITSFYFAISGSWMLLIGVTHDEETRRGKKR